MDHTKAIERLERRRLSRAATVQQKDFNRITGSLKKALSELLEDFPLHLKDEEGHFVDEDYPFDSSYQQGEADGYLRLLDVMLRVSKDKRYSVSERAFLKKFMDDVHDFVESHY